MAGDVEGEDGWSLDLLCSDIGDVFLGDVRQQSAQGGVVVCKLVANGKEMVQ